MAEEEASGTLRMVHAFGARSSVPRLGNIEDRTPLPKPLHFVEDTNTLMYTVGRRVVVHSIDTNTMRFIPENDRLEVPLSAVHAALPLSLPSAMTPEALRRGICKPLAVGP